MLTDNQITSVKTALTDARYTWRTFGAIVAQITNDGFSEDFDQDYLTQWLDSSPNIVTKTRRRDGTDLYKWVEVADGNLTEEEASKAMEALTDTRWNKRSVSAVATAAGVTEEKIRAWAAADGRISATLRQRDLTILLKYNPPTPDYDDDYEDDDDYDDIDDGDGDLDGEDDLEGYDDYDDDPLATW